MSTPASLSKIVSASTVPFARCPPLRWCSTRKGLPVYERKRRLSRREEGGHAA